MKDQLTLSISVAVGSTIVRFVCFLLLLLVTYVHNEQTALFVMPVMVVLGWIIDKPLALLFDPFESVVSLPSSSQPRQNGSELRSPIGIVHFRTYDGVCCRRRQVQLARRRHPRL